MLADHLASVMYCEVRELPESEGSLAVPIAASMLEKLPAAFADFNQRPIHSASLYSAFSAWAISIVGKDGFNALLGEGKPILDIVALLSVRRIGYSGVCFVK